MEFRHLGRSGLQVSTLGLGTNNFGGRTEAGPSARVLREALDLGITFIDTSNFYADGRSEEIIGETLAGHRHQVILATKASSPAGTRMSVLLDQKVRPEAFPTGIPMSV